MKLVASVVALAAVMAALSFGTAASADRRDGGTVETSAAAAKVPICHATHSPNNPYVLIIVPLERARGHLTGSPHGPDFSWPDIVPGSMGYDGYWYDSNCERMDVLPSKAAVDGEQTEVVAWSTVKARF
jgi:hypothetical protein